MKNKKWMFVGIGVLMMTVVTISYNIFTSSKPTSLLDANIEALTRAEEPIKISCVVNPIWNNGPGCFVCVDDGCQFIYGTAVPPRDVFTKTCYL